ncbi:DUF5776 domain-containing protein [Levilactobacillus lanxiensis]|uniref:DUF5776 domain-containing protein n=1 Tax=Levilactobacillus lanxiensis TaxID=2799568 RepID=UPI00194482F3|nr:DUF5776 domain-containing protein [Levilactobacillus lanxiensis]
MGTAEDHGNLYTGGTSDDRYPLYLDDGSRYSSDGDGDVTAGMHKMIDNIIIDADTGVVYYGMFFSSHLDTDVFYMKFDSAKMTFESNTKPVKITLNFYDTADPTKTIQTRTVDTGFDADTPLFDAAMSGLKALNVQLKGYTLDSKTSTTSTTDTADQTATVNYYYTKDSDTNTSSDHPSTRTSNEASNTNSNTSSSTSSATPAAATSSSASLTTSGAADQADATKVSAVKVSAVYATKKIALYNKPTFTKSTRTHWYTKQTRPNRPQFVVTGYARSNAGRLRYRVRSLDGRTGYITANANFVRNTYYHANPKTIRVIGNHGLNAYHKVNLSGKVRHYKRDTTLKIKRIEKHNLTTRLVLTNGTYITGNKTLVIKK